MANRSVIITKTVHTKDADGNTVKYSPSAEPQLIDAELAAEGLAKGWAEKPVKAKAAKPAGEGGSEEETSDE